MENAAIDILLADDDESDRLLFIEAFDELKIETTVHTVNDGMQLMNYLSQKEISLPHLVFLDLNMPRKNGLECLKEIRSNETLKGISIAIYSTSASEKDIEETFIHGANVYITKPTDFNILKQLLKKAIVSSNMYQHTTFNKENFLLRV